MQEVSCDFVAMAVLHIGHFEKNLKTHGKNSITQEKAQGLCNIRKIGSRNSIFSHKNVNPNAFFARHKKAERFCVKLKLFILKVMIF